MEPEAPREFKDLPNVLVVAIFGHLSPQTLALASCVCSSWQTIASQAPWAQACAALWPSPADGAAADADGDAGWWQRQYGRSQLAARCWLGRPSMDKLMGHSDAVKACCLLPQHGLVLAGAPPPLAWLARRLAAPPGCLRCWPRCPCPRHTPAAAHPTAAAGGMDRTVRVWDLHSGIQLAAR